jgi:hypothetical protein
VSDLQDVIATNAIRAYNEGVARGATEENHRVVLLLESKVCGDESCIHEVCSFSLEAITLIKGE